VEALYAKAINDPQSSERFECVSVSYNAFVLFGSYFSLVVFMTVY